MIETDLTLRGLGVFTIEAIVILSKVMQGKDSPDVDEETMAGALHFLADAAADALLRWGATPDDEPLLVALGSVQDACRALTG